MSIQEKSLVLAVQNKYHRGVSSSGSVERVTENKDVLLGWKVGIACLHSKRGSEIFWCETRQT